MKPMKHSAPTNVQQVPSSDEVKALDQSEKEYNRMISQHMMYHRLLMDDLIKLSSESGSGSGSGSMSLPQQLLQQQMAQAQQANTVQGLGTTIGNMNTNRDQLMKSASKFAGNATVNAQTVARLNRFIQQNASALVKNLDSLDSLDSVDATTATNKTVEGFAVSAPSPTLDGALEVSALMRESHKYALIVAGVIAIYLLYKTTKTL
jgi:hypothetical protein